MATETRSERAIRKYLNPRGPAQIRVMLAYERGVQRERQLIAAYTFLVDGEDAANDLRVKPPYGRKWNREYNPLPYPEAKPRGEHRIDMFIGTGVGAIYNLMESQHHLWQLAGWTLTGKGAEVRRKRKW